MNSNWDKVISDSDLISLPQVYLKLQQVLYSDDFSLDDIVEVISLDPAITARLLHMVNSSFFGLAAKIETVSHAVNYLGAQQVHDLVLTASIAKTFSEIHNPDFDLNQFWKNSIYHAISAREIAVLCNVIDSERLFVSGLLSHIGSLMMSQSLTPLTQQASSLAQQTNKALYLCEQEVIGFDHAAVGAALLKSWHLPDNLCESIKYQIEPSKCDLYALETSILHISGQMALAFEQGMAIEEVVPQIDRHALKLTNMTPEQLNSIDNLARENLGHVVQMLFPNT